MRRSMLLLVTSLSFASGCIRTAPDPATGRVDVDIESPTKKGEDWKATLAGQGPYATVRGSATALVTGGRTTVTVSLQDATPGVSYPWEIREGKCDQRGPVVGDPGAYGSLTVGSDGRASASAQLVASLNEAKDYIVVVYAPGSDRATVVACGDLDD